MSTKSDVSQQSPFLVVLECIILDVIIAYYSLRKAIIIGELTLYEDKLA